MKPFNRYSILAFGWMTVLSLLCAGPASANAQNAAIAAPQPDTPIKSPSETPVAPNEEQTLAELREKRRKAQAEMALAESKKPAASPAEATPEELQERRDHLTDLIRAYEEHANELLRLRDARHQRAEVERTAAEWKGFEEPPPHPVAMVDQLWDSAYALQRTVEGLESQVNLLTLRFDRARQRLTAAEGRLRQSSEKFETADESEDAPRLRWLQNLAEVRRHAAAAVLAASEVAKRRVEEQLMEAQSRLSLTRRQLDTADTQMRFSEGDLKNALTRLAEERHGYESELEAVVTEHRRKAKTLEAVEQHRPRQTSTSGGRHKDTARSATFKAAVELAQLEVETLVTRSDLLRQMIEMVERERQLWESRADILLKEDATHAREAWQRLTPLANSLRASRDYMRQQLGVVSTHISEVDHRVHTLDRREKEADRDRLSLYRQQEHAYNRALQRIDLTERFLERWRSEFKQQWKELPLSARAEEWLAQVWTLVYAAWSFEVFVAEDTIEVDGKTMTGSRSVTIGKIVSALLIFVIGYVVSLSLSRLIGRVVMRRLGTTPEVAQIVRQWSQALLVMVVIVISFVFVKIPLTIFAFLGGAFAIGVGFGAQNLLKNVISGLLVLIERPLRVGDLVEVDKVRGRVTSIGLRSSTIRDANGMETLIPNSNFLDRYLTNWTYSSSISRFSLRLGVSYEAPSQQTRQLLRDILDHHPHVAKIPPPHVLLDDFGATARIYSLHYWLEIRLDVDPGEVASDLRLAIEEQFTERNLKVLPAG